MRPLGARRRRAVGLGRATLAVLLAGGLGAACSVPPRPHLILIVIDTLRADHLGAYGYARPTSPHLDALAARGVLFTRAFAPSSWTRPSVASLFTSRLPSEHGAVSMEHPLAADLATLAERLREAGYRTLGVCGNFVHVTEEAGLTRGFDEWKAVSVELDDAEGDVVWTHPVRGRPVRLRAPRATEINREVLARLGRPGPDPIFLYVHYMDPHSGYDPPASVRGLFARAEPDATAPPATSDYVVDLAAGRREPAPGERERLIDLYDAEVRFVDEAVGALLEELDTRGFGETAVVAVVSDHGEEFAEHGSWFHGLTLHGESLRVPVILHDARRPPAGVRREEPVDLLDVATTLLDAAGLEKAPGMRGRALLGAEPGPGRPELVAELHADPLFEVHVRSRPHRLALLRWPWKVILPREGAPAAFRLDRDPAEQEALDVEAAALPAELVEALRARLTGTGDAEPPGPPAELGPETRDALRALGYLE